MSDIAIRVEALSKRYRIGQRESYYTLRDYLTNIIKSPFSRHPDSQYIWALKGITFEVKHNEAVGIIGRNGAGKTTLLKILSRITEPTEGYAELRGRVGSLLEIGTGFHPELTGRENIYLNGAIMGMKKSEIVRKFDEIVDFSGVEKFIDTPVKYYSSGMHVRLAFAVAAHLEPEILVVDEVLAVGDVAFQEKCLGKMAEVAGGGRTVLFVSHNMSAILSLCPTSIWLDAGRIVFQGKSSDAISRYVDATRIHSNQAVSLADRRDRIGSGLLQITQVYIEDAEGKRCDSARCGDPVRFVLEYRAASGAQLDNVVVNLVFADNRGQRLFSCLSEISGAVLTNLPPYGCLICTVPEFPLLPGCYDFHFTCIVDRQLASKVLNAGSMIVSEGDFFGTGRLTTHTDYYGSILVRHKWSVESRSQDL